MFHGADGTASAPVGGRNGNWDDDINGITAAFSIIGAALGDMQVSETGAKIDDGDLSGSQFIKANTRYMYILQK